MVKTCYSYGDNGIRCDTPVCADEWYCPKCMAKYIEHSAMVRRHVTAQAMLLKAYAGAQELDSGVDAARERIEVDAEGDDARIRSK